MPGARYMEMAFAAAEAAGLEGEVPVGAVLVDPASGMVLAIAHNRTVALSDPTAHAEVLAIRAACAAAGSPRLPDVDLYVTLEPCALCAAAISAARLRRVYYGAYDPKGGGIDHGVRLFDHSSCLHRPEVYAGLQESRAAALLQAFFKQRR